VRVRYPLCFYPVSVFLLCFEVSGDGSVSDRVRFLFELLDLFRVNWLDRYCFFVKPEPLYERAPRSTLPTGSEKERRVCCCL